MKEEKVTFEASSNSNGEELDGRAQEEVRSDYILARDRVRRQIKPS